MLVVVIMVVVVMVIMVVVVAMMIMRFAKVGRLEWVGRLFSHLRKRNQVLHLYFYGSITSLLCQSGISCHGTIFASEKRAHV